MSTVKSTIATGVGMALCAWHGASTAAEIPYEAWFPGTSRIAEVEVIPPAYRGKWAPTKAQCEEKYGVDRIEVFPLGLDTYESGGRLVRITQSGQARSVRMKISYEGEGRFWDSEEIWTLNETGDRLNVADADKQARASLVRCD